MKIKVLGFFFSLLILSCSNEPMLPEKSKFPLFYKASFDHDSARLRIGLPQIGNKLKLKWCTNNCFTEYFAFCIHFESNDTSVRPRLDFKRIVTDSVEICTESNTIIGPNYEELKIFYGYKQYYDMTFLGFDCSFKYKKQSRIDITKKEADSILEKWNYKMF